MLSGCSLPFHVEIDIGLLDATNWPLVFLYATQVVLLAYIIGRLLGLLRENPLAVLIAIIMAIPFAVVLIPTGYVVRVADGPAWGSACENHTVTW